MRGPDAKPLDPSSVYSLQVMLSKFEYDGERAVSLSSPKGCPKETCKCLVTEPAQPPCRGVATPNRAPTRALKEVSCDRAHDPSPRPGKLNPAFKAGPFQLPIAEISAYLASPVTPRMVHVSSAGVTRPNRPGINVDMV